MGVNRDQQQEIIRHRGTETGECDPGSEAASNPCSLYRNATLDPASRSTVSLEKWLCGQSRP